MNRFLLCNSWCVFWDILHSYNRRNELNRLIKWARNRKLEAPRKLYESRQNEEENRLMRYKWRYPGLDRCAYLLYLAGKLVSQSPKYLPRGSASIYRYKQSL